MFIKLKLFFTLPRILILNFFFSSLIWSLITPLGASPDEAAHVQYASAVNTYGYSNLVEKNFIVELPENISSTIDIEYCFFQNVDSPARCYEAIKTSETFPTEVELRTKNYPAFYQALVGLPTQFGFSGSIWHLMRLMSVLLNSLIFGLTISMISHLLTRNSLFAILLSVTPFATFLVGSVNPSSVEITSGISAAILLIFYPRFSNLQKDKGRFLLLLFVILTWLSVSRPYTWLIALGLVVVFFIRHLNQKNFNRMSLALVSLVPIMIGANLNRIILVFSSSRDSINIMADVNSIPSAVQPLNLVFLSQFSKLDNNLYDSIGYFAWIMSYRGLELVNTLWVAFILLSILWSLQVFKRWENLSLLLLVTGSLIIVPILAYAVIFEAGYGFQARYVMALLCAIPILAIVGNQFDVEVELKSLRVAYIFVPFAFVSSWIISALRYSYGFPLKLFSGDGRPFSWWLGDFSTSLLILTLISYLSFLVFSIPTLRKSLDQIGDKL